MAWQLTRALDQLRDFEEYAKRACEKGGTSLRVPDVQIMKSLKPMVEYCQRQCEAIELTHALARINNQFLLKIRDGITFGDVCTEIKVLREAIDSQLCFRRFAYIADEKTKELDKWRNTWANVLTQFPDAEDEIRNAVLCFSVELYTATVFHMIRVAELGLRQLALKLAITLKNSVELEDWKTVLNAIEKKLEDLHNSPKSAVRQQDLRFYSDAASHLRYIKQWRNDISHMRCVYYEPEAKSSMLRARELLELICPVAALSA